MVRAYARNITEINRKRKKTEAWQIRWQGILEVQYELSAMRGKTMKLIRADYMMIIGFILLAGAHSTTNYLINSYQDVARTVGVAEEAVLLMEANPVARYFFGLEMGKHIFSFVLAPALLIGLYYNLRRKYAKDIVVLESYAIAFVALALIDALNDISILLGFLVAVG